MATEWLQSPTEYVFLMTRLPQWHQPLHGLGPHRQGGSDAGQVEPDPFSERAPRTNPFALCRRDAETGHGCGESAQVLDNVTSYNNYAAIIPYLFPMKTIDVQFSGIVQFPLFMGISYFLCSRPVSKFRKPAIVFV
jgi:hypothetical protein